MPVDLKLPFPSSPIRVRLQSTHSRSGAPNQIGSVSKPKPVTRSMMNVERSETQPTYETISAEFQELAKMVKKGCNGEEPNSSKSKSSLLFKRGKFYDEYSARRNERLKRKKSSEEEEENKLIFDPGFASEPVKKRNLKKSDDLNTSVSKMPLMEINESVNPIPRYSLRSRTKDMPPLPTSSVGGGGGRKPAGGRARKS